jgi:hypothetical protein
MEIISRADALAQGLKRYYTGEPCRHGHIAEHYVGRACTECIAFRSAAWRRANPE